MSPGAAVALLTAIRAVRLTVGLTVVLARQSSAPLPGAQLVPAATTVLVSDAVPGLQPVVSSRMLIVRLTEPPAATLTLFQLTVDPLSDPPLFAPWKELFASSEPMLSLTSTVPAVPPLFERMMV